MRGTLVIATVSAALAAFSPIANAGTTGSISGYVTAAADGSAVTDGWIRVVNVSDPYMDVQTFYTDATGLYTVDGLPAGDYYVQVGSFGTELAFEWYPDRPSFDGAVSVAVVADQQTPLSFALEIGGTLSGTVTDQDGQPLEGIRVIANHKSGDIFGQDPSYGEDGYDYTAADGTYTITALGAQDYLIHFGEGSAYIEKYYNDKLGLATADPVAVALGVATTGIDVSLQLGGAIEGIVTDAVSGEPVPDLFVSAYVPGESGTPGFRDGSVTLVDGSYRLEGLKTGSFVLQGQDLGNNVYAGFFHGGDTEQSARRLSVIVGETVSLDLTATLRFTDANTSVFREDVKWLAVEGITTGCGSSLFCVDKSVTRGQMAAFLTRALELPATTTDFFTDDDASIFESDINRVAAAGITLGCNPPSNDNYCPDRSVTRGQMAAFLVRALGYTDDNGGNLFVDDDGSVFETAIDRLATAGVTRGCNPPTNDRYCPGRGVTRGQMAAFLHRALG